MGSEHDVGEGQVRQAKGFPRELDSITATAPGLQKVVCSWIASGLGNPHTSS